MPNQAATLPRLEPGSIERTRLLVGEELGAHLLERMRRDHLFLPGLKDDQPGTRLSNMERAPLAEIMGRLPWAAEVFNCVTPDTPLSHLWSWGRAMRFFDGPDEVHLRTPARVELAKARENLGSTAPYDNLH